MHRSELALTLGGRPQGAIAGKWDEDALLVHKFQQGDSSAFEDLFKKYQKQIYNFICRMVSADDAFDITQDTFYHAMRGIGGFKPGKRFSTWLFAIAKNRCFDVLRRRGRIQNVEFNEKLHAAPAGSEGDPVHHARKRELCDIVQECLSQLSERDRLVITLRDFNQLSHEEMSEVLGASIASVKSKIHRARLRFRKLFEPHYRELTQEQAAATTAQ